MYRYEGTRINLLEQKKANMRIKKLDSQQIMQSSCIQHNNENHTSNLHPT